MAFNREFFDYQCFKHGVTRGKVAANALGVTYPTFLRKITGDSEWKLSEVESLVDYFGLSEDERDKMFGLGDKCSFSVTSDLP